MAKVGFFASHQDDETLTMGAAIVNHLEAGHDVHVFVATDGKASNARKVINGEFHCYYHNSTHDPVAENYADGSLSAEEFGYARDYEFLRACEALGVPTANIHFNDVTRYADGGLTVAKAETFIETNVNNFGIELVKSHSEYDTHTDHASLGQALRNLKNSGKIKDARFYAKRENWDTTPVSLGDEIPNNTEYVKSAAEQYDLWNPTGGTTGIATYAIGEHSVPTSFDALKADIRSKWHR